MYTTRDVYGNPRFIIHFLDLVHEDHPGDHVDKMESARRMANKHGGKRYRGRVFGRGFVFQTNFTTTSMKRIAKYETNEVERDRGLGPRQPQYIQRINRP